MAKWIRAKSAVALELATISSQGLCPACLAKQRERPTVGATESQPAMSSSRFTAPHSIGLAHAGVSGARTRSRPHGEAFRTSHPKSPSAAWLSRETGCERKLAHAPRGMADPWRARCECVKLWQTHLCFNESDATSESIQNDAVAEEVEATPRRLGVRATPSSPDLRRRGGT